jgi:coenzyme F420-reducing hydrogenase delta subunit
MRSTRENSSEKGKTLVGTIIGNFSLNIRIKYGKHCSTSVDNKWLPQRVNLEKVQNILLANIKISECHTVAM